MTETAQLVNGRAGVWMHLDLLLTPGAFHCCVLTLREGSDLGGGTWVICIVSLMSQPWLEAEVLGAPQEAPPGVLTILFSPPSSAHAAAGIWMRVGCLATWIQILP